MRSWLLVFACGCASVPVIPDRVPGTLVAYSGTEDAVPLVVTDASEPCGDERRHVELVDVPTGQTRWRADGWQEVVGRMAEGALLVSNEGAPGARGLELGVLDTTQGRVLGTCAVSTPNLPGRIAWQAARPGVLRGVVHERYRPTGVPVEPRPPFGVEVRFGIWGCELVRLAELPFPERADSTLPPVSLWGLLLGDVTFEFPKEPPPSVVARRGDTVLWRKQVGVVEEPCRVP